jgi:carboxypeptidase PM20D1
MKRATKIGLAIAGVTAAASAAALKASSRTNDVPVDEAERAEPFVEPGIDGDAFLAHLGEAIRIDTTSYDDRSLIDGDSFLEFHDFLERTYPLVHEVCDKEVIADHSLLFTWKGTDEAADPIVLMAHIDVVPVEAGTEADWDHPPFSGMRADGHVWGRGALDDKGPLIATIEAVEHLLREGFTPKRTVLITFGHDEEISGVEGASAVAELVRGRGVTPFMVLDEGGAVADGLPMLSDEPVALIKVAEKGYVDVQITAKGEGGHSSMPPTSTAVGAIAEAVRRLESNPMPARLSVVAPLFEALAPRMDPKIRAVLTNLKVTGPAVGKMLAKDPTTNALIRTTTAVTVVSGGHKANVLPQEASAIVNFRIIPGETVDDVLEHVRQVVGPDIEANVPGGWQANDPSPFSSQESDAWNVVSTAVEETFPEAVVAPWVLTGATDSRYWNDFAHDVYGFGPFTIPLRDSGFHDTNERVRETDAERAVSFYIRIIRRANED